jgi:hypothetical protein
VTADKSLKERLEARIAHIEGVYPMEEQTTLRAIAQALQEQADEIRGAGNPGYSYSDISTGQLDAWGDALAPRNEAPGRETE